MYRVVYEDKPVNASGVLAEHKTLEEAEYICNEERKTWKDTYIEKEGE